MQKSLLAMIALMTTTSYAMEKIDQEAIFEAIRKNDLGRVQFLFYKGADINAREPNGCTLLHIAAAGRDNGHIIQLLILRKAHLNTTNKEGATPLDYAIVRRNFDAVSLLLQHGASINNDGHLPLHLTVGYSKRDWDIATGELSPINRRGNIARLLVEYGADINVLDSQHKTVEQRVSKHFGFEEVVEVLRCARAADMLTYLQARTILIGKYKNPGSLIAQLSLFLICDIFKFVKIDQRRFALDPEHRQEIIEKAAQAELPKPRATNPYCLMQ